MHSYKVTSIKRSPTGRFISADLTERGIVIGRVTRGAMPYSYAVRFLSSQAEGRFDDFCDSLSRSETIEAIIPVTAR